MCQIRLRRSKILVYTIIEISGMSCKTSMIFKDLFEERNCRLKEFRCLLYSSRIFDVNKLMTWKSLIPTILEKFASSHKIFGSSRLSKHALYIYVVNILLKIKTKDVFVNIKQACASLPWTWADYRVEIGTYEKGGHFQHFQCREIFPRCQYSGSQIIFYSCRLQPKSIFTLFYLFFYSILM